MAKGTITTQGLFQWVPGRGRGAEAEAGRAVKRGALPPHPRRRGETTPRPQHTGWAAPSTQLEGGETPTENRHPPTPRGRQGAGTALLGPRGRTHSY